MIVLMPCIPALNPARNLARKGAWNAHLYCTSTRPLALGILAYVTPWAQDPHLLYWY